MGQRLLALHHHWGRQMGRRGHAGGLLRGRAGCVCMRGWLVVLDCGVVTCAFLFLQGGRHSCAATRNGSPLPSALPWGVDIPRPPALAGAGSWLSAPSAPFQPPPTSLVSHHSAPIARVVGNQAAWRFWEVAAWATAATPTACTSRWTRWLACAASSPRLAAPQLSTLPSLWL